MGYVSKETGGALVGSIGFINWVDMNWPLYRDSKAEISSIGPSWERNTKGSNEGLTLITSAFEFLYRG